MAKLQSLVKETAIYGLSSIFGRFLNYLLVPLYTAKMSASSGEYGIVTNIYAWVAILLIVITFGMETTFFRFVNKEKADISKVFSMSLQIIGLISLVFLALIFYNIGSISDFLGYASTPQFIYIMSLVVVLDAMQSIPFGYLRNSKRPIKFASLKLLNIFSNILLNLILFLLIPYLYSKEPHIIGRFYNPELQTTYIFLINLICTAFVTLFFIPELRIFRFTADWKLLKQMLTYSWPLMLLGMAGMLNLNADKIIYTFLVPGTEGEVQLGIYGAAVKIAAIMAMLTQAFRYAYEPFVFSNNNKGDSKGVYAKVMKFFIIVALFAFLAVMFYTDIIRYIIAPDYWEGLKVVPIIMIAEIFMGIYFNLSFWYKLNDETWWGALFSTIGCVVLFAINIIFVPQYGYMACAWAALSGYFVAMVLSYFVGQRRNPTHYELKSILRYCILTIILYSISLLLSFLPTIWHLLCNTLLLFVFAAYIIKKDLPVKQIPILNRFID